MTDLKPCPFCGGPAVLVQPVLGRLYVACEILFCSGPKKTPQDAIAAWNCRANEGFPAGRTDADTHNAGSGPKPDQQETP